MSLFKNLTTDGLEAATDNAGFSKYESDIYPAVIKAAYAGKSEGGAHNVTLLLDINGRPYTETIYITNKKGENFFLNKQDPTKKVPLPGFTIIDDVCWVTSEKSLAEQDTEERVIKLYNYDEKKEIPTKVEMLVDLIGLKLDVAILKSLQNKKKKNDATGAYEAIAETQEVNNIEKVFHQETGLTMVEIRNEMKEPDFRNTWLTRNKGVTRDKTEKVAAGAGTAGAPPKPSAPGESAPKKSGLFGKK